MGFSGVRLVWLWLNTNFPSFLIQQPGHGWSLFGDDQIMMKVHNINLEIVQLIPFFFVPNKTIIMELGVLSG